jgi:hypothetical protein
LWLTISASAGASFRVPMKKRDAFIQIFQMRRAASCSNGGEAGESKVNKRNDQRNDQRTEDFAVFRLRWQSLSDRHVKSCPELGLVPVRRA